ncbi:MAG: hypothetical protein AAF384_20035 [Pseudomonadota bacterium]
MKHFVKVFLITFLYSSTSSAVIIQSADVLDFNLTAQTFNDIGCCPTNSALVSLSGDLSVDNAQGVGSPATGTHGYTNFTSALAGAEYVLNGDENFDLIFTSPAMAFAMNYSDTSVASIFTLKFFEGVTNIGST